jgi:hypothetical protein
VIDRSETIKVNVGAIPALRNPKIADLMFEDLLDQRILQKGASIWVEEIKRKYKLRP